jgi:nicotinamide-nucleotide adenylyltransferase
VVTLQHLLEEARRSEEPTLLVWPPGTGSTARSAALLPGSFDPLTVGHEALAEAALGSSADVVVLAYSARTLPKEGPAAEPLLDEATRLASLREYAEGRAGLVVGVTSHGLLADQAVAAARRFPDLKLFVVAGADKVAQLFDPRWYADRDAELDRLFDAATVLAAGRGGDHPSVEELLARPENHRYRDLVVMLEVPPAVLSVSSRAVREAIRRGEDVRGLVPSAIRPFLPRRD